MSPGDRRGEHGYVLVLTALVLPALMLMAAFAVDLGSWYARAAQLQRGADAAALAGVVWMPNNFDKAEDEAIAAATRNGLVHGEGNVTVTVSRVPQQPQQLQVTIVDADAEAYFGQVVLDHITLSRTAVARFVLPIPLGSPLNGFGNQGLPPSAAVTDEHPQFWAAINAPYTGKQQGDPYATKCVRPSSTTSCVSDNDEYRESGYLYAITVPETEVGKTLTVEVFDAPFRPRTGGVAEGYVDFGGQTNGPYISYELFDADVTPLDNTDNPPLVGTGRCLNSSPGRLLSAPATNAGQVEKWSTVCEVVANKSGVFPFRVKSSNHPAPGVDRASATAHYAVKATLSGTVQPRVYALNDMSIYTGGEATPTALGSSSDFYLAEVEPVYAGKQLVIELYDPGDGSLGNFYVSILQPDGTVASCTYSDTSGTLSTTPDACRIQTRVNSAGSPNVYDGKWLKIVVSLPTTYTCTTGDCWWKVKYEFRDFARPTDRTVWRANVTGDPVGLVR
jgi:hypothetical protein